MATTEMIDTAEYRISKPLTAAQLRDIEISEQQITAGFVISHEDFMRELDEEYPDDEN
jgi:hypothetical protein